MPGHGNPVLTYTGPCVLTAACMHPPPHVHVAVGVDQLLQSVLGRGSARLQSKDSLSVSLKSPPKIKKNPPSHSSSV